MIYPAQKTDSIMKELARPERYFAFIGNKDRDICFRELPINLIDFFMQPIQQFLNAKFFIILKMLCLTHPCS